VREDEADGSTGITEMDEPGARAMLVSYGIPVAPWEWAGTEEEAVSAAVRLAFPVVLKGIVPGIRHKTEAGLVELDLPDRASVRAAFRRLRDTAGGALLGVLVERLIRGRREFVAGVFRDPQFGPVVMFGVGGTLTEALNDVAFGVAPLLPGEAEQMIGTIRAARLLDAYRGEPPVDRRALVSVLEALARLAGEHAEITEIDLNPLVVCGSAPVAVDVLVMTGGAGRPAEASAGHVSPGALRALFAPTSVAVVGASAHPGKWGGSLLVNLVGEGYPGRLYPVHASAQSVLGLPAYPSVSALPEAPDLALVAVPGGQLLGVVDECGRKGVRALVVVSAGFGEHSTDGAALERAAADSASRYGMALLGPNTVGVISPAAGLCAMGSVPLRVAPGGLGLLSQSGNVALQLMLMANKWRLGIGRFVGLGNEAQVTAADLLDHFREDPEVDAVLGYVEGVRAGRRFLEAARHTTSTKPVVILRGGTSSSGRAAAASHTGALAGESRVFAAAARQAGITLTHDQDESMDAVVAFSRVPLPPGRRVAVVTSGGGWGVLCADEIERHGMAMAQLPAGLVARLDAVLPAFWSRANPVDLVATVGEGVVEDVLASLLASGSVDAVVMLGVLSILAMAPRMRRKGADVRRALGMGPAVPLETAEFRCREEAVVVAAGSLMEEYGKPVLAVELARGTHIEDRGSGPYRLVVYPSPLRAVRALGHLARYAEHKVGLDGI
jgi:acyl-CoA synthetase (NDP forming)